MAKSRFLTDTSSNQLFFFVGFAQLYLLLFPVFRCAIPVGLRPLALLARCGFDIIYCICTLFIKIPVDACVYFLIFCECLCIEIHTSYIRGTRQVRGGVKSL